MSYGPRVTRRTVLSALAAAPAVAPLSRYALRQDVGPTQFMNWDASIAGTPTEAAVQAYTAETGRVVEMIPAPGTGTDYETRVRTMLAGGTVPDVIRTNDDFVRFYSAREQFTDLRPFIERDAVNPADYYEPIWNFAIQPDGAYGAVTLGNQPRLIYYNVDMFEAAGVPLPPRDWTSAGWTWDDFLATAQALTIAGERWGALIYDDTGCEQTFAVNNGLAEGIYSEDGQSFLLAEPQGVEAIQWLADLTLVHGVQPERGLVLESNTGNNLFLQGRIAMIFRTQGTMAYFRNNGITFRFDVAPPPARVDHRTEGSLICYAIPTAAVNPEGAWQLLKWLSGPGGSQVFARRGDFIPAHIASAQAIVPQEGVSPSNLGLFATASGYQTSVNFTEYTENARNTYRPQLDLVWTGESTAEEVLTGVRQDVEDILSGAF